MLHPALWEPWRGIGRAKPHEGDPTIVLRVGLDASHTWVQTLPLPCIYQARDRETSTGLCASLTSKKGTTPRARGCAVLCKRASDGLGLWKVHAEEETKGELARVGLGPYTLLSRPWPKVPDGSGATQSGCQQTQLGVRRPQPPTPRVAGPLCSSLGVRLASPFLPQHLAPAQLPSCAAARHWHQPGRPGMVSDPLLAWSPVGASLHGTCNPLCPWLAVHAGSVHPFAPPRPQQSGCLGEGQLPGTVLGSEWVNRAHAHVRRV